MVSEATRGASMPVGAAVAANCTSMLGEGKPHTSDDNEQTPPHDQTVTAELEMTSNGLRLHRPRRPRHRGGCCASTLGLRAEDADGVRVLLRPSCTLMAFDWPAPVVINSAAAAPRVLSVGGVKVADFTAIMREMRKLETGDSIVLALGDEGRQLEADVHQGTMVSRQLEADATKHVEVAGGEEKPPLPEIFARDYEPLNQTAGSAILRAAASA
jgi:hypothetical protein